MNDSTFFKRHGVRYSDIIKVSSESTTGMEAAKKLGIPYKTYIRISSKLKCRIKNPGGKGTIKKGVSKYNLDDILSGLHPNVPTMKVKARLIKNGIKEWKCESCGITEWLGKRIALELDHINGNNSDHRLENLRILCPNCHSQTDTHSGKNAKIKVQNKCPEIVAHIDKVINPVKENKNLKLIEEIKNSTIDFNRYGWVQKASIIIGIKPQKVGQWMQKNMPDFYELCYRR